MRKIGVMVRDVYLTSSGDFSCGEAEFLDLDDCSTGEALSMAAPTAFQVARGDHRRDHRRAEPTPGCSWCVTEAWDWRGQRWEARAGPPEGVAGRGPHLVGRGQDLVGLGTKSWSSDRVDSTRSKENPSLDALPTRPLIELDRPDVAALRVIGWKFLEREQLALLDAIAASQLTGPSVEAGREWIAGQVRGCGKGTNRIKALVGAFTALGGSIGSASGRGRSGMDGHQPTRLESAGSTPAPRSSGPPTPIRDVVVREFQELVESGELRPEARPLWERLLEREEVHGDVVTNPA